MIQNSNYFIFSLLCKFFPDDNTETCLLKMIGNNLDGDLEREYKVEELTDEMMSRDLCWHCPGKYPFINCWIVR